MGDTVFTVFGLASYHGRKVTKSLQNSGGMMNKFQRAGQGVYGAIENALDDLRHTWERFAYGRKITGEVDMFTPTYEHAPDPHQGTREAFERVYGKRDSPEQGQEREGRAREQEQDREIER